MPIYTSALSASTTADTGISLQQTQTDIGGTVLTGGLIQTRLGVSNTSSFSGTNNVFPDGWNTILYGPISIQPAASFSISGSANLKIIDINN